MSRVREVFSYIFTKPLEAIEFCVASALFLQALWLVSPLYNPVVSSIAGAGGAVVVIGLIQLSLAVFAIWTLCNLRWPNREKGRRFYTGAFFYMYCFYAIAQAILFQLTSVLWVTTLLLAFINGLCFFAIGRELNGG